MIHTQNEKEVVMLSPGAVIATDATATGRVDCLGFQYATISVLVNSTTGGTSPPTVLKITEGETTTASDAITALTGGSGFSIPNTTTAAPAGIVKFHLDLRKRKRYLLLSVTPSIAGGQYISAVCRLSRANTAPDTAAEAGVTARIIE